MALTVGDRSVRPLTADEVMRMVEAGILTEDERVELLHGVLTRVSPKGAMHGGVISRLIGWLAPGVAAGRYQVRTEHPLLVPDRTSLPEPDVAVVAPTADALTHPTTALLAIEVAVSSQRVDLGIKPPLYASAGVPEYWVVNLRSRSVEVFTQPGAAGYATRETHAPPDRLRPVAVEADPLDLAALLAGV